MSVATTCAIDRRARRAWMPQPAPDIEPGPRRRRQLQRRQGQGGSADTQHVVFGKRPAHRCFVEVARDPPFGVAELVDEDCGRMSATARTLSALDPREAEVLEARDAGSRQGRGHRGRRLRRRRGRTGARARRPRDRCRRRRAQGDPRDRGRSRRRPSDPTAPRRRAGREAGLAADRRRGRGTGCGTGPEARDPFKHRHPDAPLASVGRRRLQGANRRITPIVRS